MITMTVDEGVQAVISAMGEDVAAGIIPWDLPDLSAAHDFVDANMYFLDLIGEDSFDPSDEEQHEWLFQVERRVARLLAGGREPYWSVAPLQYASYVWNRKRALLPYRAAYWHMSMTRMADRDGVPLPDDDMPEQYQPGRMLAMDQNP